MRHRWPGRPLGVAPGCCTRPPGAHPAGLGVPRTAGWSPTRTGHRCRGPPGERRRVAWYATGRPPLARRPVPGELDAIPDAEVHALAADGGVHVSRIPDQVQRAVAEGGRQPVLGGEGRHPGHLGDPGPGRGAFVEQLLEPGSIRFPIRRHVGDHPGQPIGQRTQHDHSGLLQPHRQTGRWLIQPDVGDHEVLRIAGTGEADTGRPAQHAADPVGRHHLRCRTHRTVGQAYPLLGQPGHRHPGPQLDAQFAGSPPQQGFGDLLGNQQSIGEAAVDVLEIHAQQGPVTVLHGQRPGRFTGGDQRLGDVDGIELLQGAGVHHQRAGVPTGLGAPLQHLDPQAESGGGRRGGQTGGSGTDDEEIGSVHGSTIHRCNRYIQR